MDIDQLSDGDLRQALIGHGVSAGPVTSTTRSLYRKKLAKVVSQEISQAKTETRQEKVQEDVIITQQKVTATENLHVQTPVDFTRCKKLESTPKPVFTGESPYRYAPHNFPSDDILRRRALYTPGGRMRTSESPLVQKKIEKFSSKTKAVDSVDSVPKKSGLPWCRLLFAVIAVIVLLVLLVYYHMESNDNKDLLTETKNTNSVEV